MTTEKGSTGVLDRLETEVAGVVEEFTQALAEQQQREAEDHPILTLGIETSCDETSVAVLSGERKLLSNVVYSSSDIHSKYGGVVPELASRAQVRAINPTIQEALEQADITLWDLTAVSVTIGPGLIGSLVVGVAAGKAIASVLEIPFVGVNHLEAHMYSCWLENETAALPALGLIASGGHTMLVHMYEHGLYEIVGRTLDDAAGEAFDKVGRLLGLPYPGGPQIDSRAKNGDPKAVAFPRAMLADGSDFSFSGLKSSVWRYLEKQTDPATDDVCASFQEAVVDVLVAKTIGAAQSRGVSNVFVSGGVAANSQLRQEMTSACKDAGLDLLLPSPELCTDNAAMVAACGYQRFRRGIRTPLDEAPDPNLPLA